MANIPRAAALAMFRIHIENGLSVAAGVGLTGLIAGWALGFDAADGGRHRRGLRQHFRPARSPAPEALDPGLGPGHRGRPSPR